jgi:predicted amidohydrolase
MSVRRSAPPEEAMSSSPSFLAAVVQLSSQDDVAENLARAEHWIDEASRAGANLVALPENFAFMGAEEVKLRIAESIPDDLAPPYGPIVGRMAKAARKAGVFLVAGGLPEASDAPGRTFNTSLLFDPNGELLARYRKMHLFDVDLPDGTKLEESRATCAGSPLDVTVATAPGLPPLGMTVCYDLRFPELYRALEERGARMVTVPAAFTLTTGKDHWHVLLRARAIENQLYVVAPAQTGKHPMGRQTYGKSLIADPWGDVVAQVREGEGVALAPIDLAYQARVRDALPSLRHKRIRAAP